MNQEYDYAPHIVIGVLIVSIVYLMAKIKTPVAVVKKDMAKREREIYDELAAAESIEELNAIEKKIQVFNSCYWGVEGGMEKMKFLEIAFDDKQHLVVNRLAIALQKY